MLRWLTHAGAGLVAVVAMLAGAVLYPAEPPAAARFVPVPVRILAVGDSRTAGGQWQAEFGELLDAGGVPHVIETEAVPGTACSYWPSRIRAALTTHRPDAVVLACGTNDNPNVTIYGEPATRWAFRATVEAIHAFRPADPVKIVPALVQYSDPILAPAWLLANEPRTNDNLYSQMRLYMPPRVTPSWLLGIADFQVIPATATYLVADPYPSPPGWIGIHPTARGYRWMARIVYDAAAAGMGWPASAGPLCDLYGHRASYPRPPGYTTCDN